MAPKQDTHQQGRRRLISVLLGTGITGWLGSIIYPVFSFLKPPEVPEISVSSLNLGEASVFPSGDSQIVKFGRTPVLVIRTEDGQFRALAATCTHLDCLVQHRPDLEGIWCACHNGRFDMQGRNISGPPPNPLELYEVSIVEGDVIVTRPQTTT